MTQEKKGYQKQEEKLMKPKLLWKGTQKEAEEHPLYKMGYDRGKEKGKLEKAEEFLDFLISLNIIEIKGIEAKPANKMLHKAKELSKEIADIREVVK
jgi:alcohol dehydrogenase YqhD (iron-dependent ADH family)